MQATVQQQWLSKTTYTRVNKMEVIQLRNLQCIKILSSLIFIGQVISYVFFFDFLKAFFKKFPVTLHLRKRKNLFPTLKIRRQYWYKHAAKKILTSE